MSCILFIHSQDNRFSLPILQAVNRNSPQPVHVVDIYRGRREGTMLMVHLGENNYMWLPPSVAYVPALFVPNAENPRIAPSVYYGEDICAVLGVPSPFLGTGGGSSGPGAEDPMSGSGVQFPRSQRMNAEEMEEILRQREASLRESGGLYELPKTPMPVSATTTAPLPSPGGGGPFGGGSGSTSYVDPGPVGSGTGGLGLGMPVAGRFGPPPPMGMPGMIGAGLGGGGAAGRTVAGLAL